MTWLRRVRWGFEFLGLCVGFPLIGFLPRRAVLWLAQHLGRIGFRFSRRDRRLAMANLEVAFPNGASSGQKEAWLRESFATASLVFLDFVWFALFPRRRLLRWVLFEESASILMARGPLIGVTGHLGNWEVLGQALARRRQPLASLVAPLDNPWIDRVVNAVRSRSGQYLVRRKGGLVRLLQQLRKGGKVALLLDQNVLPEEGGTFVPFFGLPVPVSRAAEVLAKRVRAPIVVCWCSVDGEGRYHVRALPALNTRRENGVAGGVTARITEQLEHIIRTSPGQWLWMYRRWKCVPPHAPRERYPYYAKSVRNAGHPAGVQRESHSNARSRS